MEGAQPQWSDYLTVLFNAVPVPPPCTALWKSSSIRALEAEPLASECFWCTGASAQRHSFPMLPWLCSQPTDSGSIKHHH